MWLQKNTEKQKPSNGLVKRASHYTGRSGRSILIVSIHDDRYGNPEYHTMIYYVPNLEELLSRERQKSEDTEEEIKKTGKTAF